MLIVDYKKKLIDKICGLLDLDIDDDDVGTEMDALEFLTALQSKDAESTTNRGRPRKSFSDKTPMSEKTLGRRFVVLDMLVKDIVGMFDSFSTCLLDSLLDTDPELVKLWHRERLDSEVKALIDVGINLVEAKVCLFACAHSNSEGKLA